MSKETKWWEPPTPAPRYLKRPRVLKYLDTYLAEKIARMQAAAKEKQHPSARAANAGAIAALREVQKDLRA